VLNVEKDNKMKHAQADDALIDGIASKEEKKLNDNFLDEKLNIENAVDLKNSEIGTKEEVIERKKSNDVKSMLQDKKMETFQADDAASGEEENLNDNFIDDKLNIENAVDLKNSEIGTTEEVIDRKLNDVRSMQQDKIMETSQEDDAVSGEEGNLNDNCIDEKLDIENAVDLENSEVGNVEKVIERKKSNDDTFMLPLSINKEIIPIPLLGQNYNYLFFLFSTVIFSLFFLKLFFRRKIKAGESLNIENKHTDDIPLSEKEVCKDEMKDQGDTEASVIVSVTNKNLNEDSEDIDNIRLNENEVYEDEMKDRNDTDATIKIIEANSSFNEDMKDTDEIPLSEKEICKDEINDRDSIEATVKVVEVDSSFNENIKITDEIPLRGKEVCKDEINNRDNTKATVKMVEVESSFNDDSKVTDEIPLREKDVCKDEINDRDNIEATVKVVEVNNSCNEDSKVTDDIPLIEKRLCTEEVFDQYRRISELQLQPVEDLVSHIDNVVKIHRRESRIEFKRSSSFSDIRSETKTVEEKTKKHTFKNAVTNVMKRKGFASTVKNLIKNRDIFIEEDNIPPVHNLKSLWEHGNIHNVRVSLLEEKDGDGILDINSSVSDGLPSKRKEIKKVRNANEDVDGSSKIGEHRKYSTTNENNNFGNSSKSVEKKKNDEIPVVEKSGVDRHKARPVSALKNLWEKGF